MGVVERAVGRAHDQRAERVGAEDDGLVASAAAVARTSRITVTILRILALLED